MPDPRDLLPPAEEVQPPARYSPPEGRPDHEAAAELTESQAAALDVLAVGGEVEHGPTVVALERRGMLEYAISDDDAVPDAIVLTDKGRATAAAVRQARQ